MDNLDHHITELENYKQKIIQLQHENSDIRDELHKVNERLVESEQLKGHFISNVSNEIVNPFSSIIALSSAIKQLDNNEMYQARQMAALIFDEAFHLDFQLKNIFAAALIEAGKEEINSSEVNLNDLFIGIRQYFLPSLDKKHVQLLDFIDCSEIFFSDKQKLELILKNLISNSIKFSSENSTIEVRITLNDEILKIDVADHGKGIQTDNKTIIFDRFKQLDEKINSINTGHGLGLSIVKAYTEMLRGSVEILSNSKGGITMSIVLPVSSEIEKLDDLNGFLFDSEASY